MTEEEKIFAGKLFDARLKELKDIKHKAHETCRKFNAMDEYDPARLPLIREFIGSIGGNYYFQGPISSITAHIRLSETTSSPTSTFS